MHAAPRTQSGPTPLKLELIGGGVSAASVAPRPWHWPFDGKRLENVRGLQISLISLVVALVLRIGLAAVLAPTATERWLMRVSGQLSGSYGTLPPLAPWIAHLARGLLGDSMLASRLPALVAATLTTFGLVRLAARMGWSKGSDVIALVCATVPLFLIGAATTSPDVLLAAFWVGAMEHSLALGLGYERRTGSWLRLGALTGLAFLTKYAGLLAAVSSVAWLLSTPHGRRALRSRGPWLGLVAFVVVSSPLLAWNALHDWKGFRLELAAAPATATADARRWASFWLWQCFLLGPPLVWGWFLLLSRACAVSRFDTDRRNLRFLAIWAVVPATVFFVQPFYGAFRPQWASLAFLPALVYFAKLSASNRAPLLLRRSVSLGILFSAIALALIHRA